MNPEIISILSIAVTVGFVNGTLPGPILAAMCTQILQRGLRSSIRIPFLCAGLVALIAITLFTVFSALEVPTRTLNIISLIGGIFLLFLAWKVGKIKNVTTKTTEVFTMKTIALLVLLNGSLWLSWFVIFLPKALQLGRIIPHGQYAFLLVYLTFWLLGIFTVSLIFTQFRGILTRPKVLPIVFKCFALVLVFFAGVMIKDATLALL